MPSRKLHSYWLRVSEERILGYHKIEIEEKILQKGSRWGKPHYLLINSL